MVNVDENPIRSTDPLEARITAGAVALPAELVEAKGHGHAGTAMGMAGVATALFGRVLRHDPADPAWVGRDRFVLSAGHASLLLYIQLHLTGYGLGIPDLQRSRTLDAPTPGHPELGHTPGVEMSTGPLGQGVASAVGLALAARRDEERHGGGTGLFDPTIWVIAGDGCLQEGVSTEAAGLAGTLGLDDLVVIWDDNRVTIDSTTDAAFAEDVRARYRAQGWRVLEIDEALDLDVVAAALEAARERTGRPTLVAVRSVIGFPAPTRAGTPAAHAGALGAEEVAAVKRRLGFDPATTAADLLPEAEVWAERARARGREWHDAWDAARERWRTEHPELAAARGRLERGPDVAEIDDVLAEVTTDADAATRSVSGAVMTALQPLDVLWGGSADLAGSTSVAMPGTALAPGARDGSEIRFGIREHAMAAALSGIALHGLWRPYGSTYLAFSDYQRPSIRLAALMGLPVLYVYTHDSVAVGEDGPTHQPVEQVASLRTVPGLDVVRPGSGREVVAAWRRLLTRADRPAALVLSRQSLPALDDLDAADAGRGGYVAWSAGSAPVEEQVALLATGSELHVAVAAAHALHEEDGLAVRVVSLPCLEWFEREDAGYRESVLPSALRRRVAIEAGRSSGWRGYVGLDGAVVGVDEFGESGSGAEVLRRRGITLEALLAAARGVVR